jgi:hypothetical protein
LLAPYHSRHARNRIAPFVLVALLCLPALRDRVTISVGGSSDALYSAGEASRFAFSSRTVKSPSRSAPHVQAEQGRIARSAKGRSRPAVSRATVQASLSESGFVACDVTYNAPTTSRSPRRRGAGVEPLKIRGCLPVPDDFDEFWAQQRAIVAGER